MLETRQKALLEDFQRLDKSLAIVQTQVKAADEAYKALNIKLSSLDKNKSNYTKEVKEIRDANENTRKLLDTRLPDDLKRLLNEAVQGRGQ